MRKIAILLFLTVFTIGKLDALTSKANGKIA